MAKPSGLISRSADVVSVAIVIVALGLAQVLIGGTRLIFSFPSYALLAIVGVLAVFSFRKNGPAPAQLCLLGAMIFFGYILIRAILSPVEYITRPDIYSVLGGLVVYLFVACICTSSKQRIAILLPLFVLALVHVWIGAVQFRDGKNFMLIPFLQRYDYGSRASGFYVCPNHLAGMLEVLGIFGTSIVCWSRLATWVKLLVAYGTIVCYIGVVISCSRGGYFSSAASLIVFGVLSLIILRKASHRLFWSIGGLCVASALVLGTIGLFIVNKSEFIMNRAQNLFDSTSVRLDMWHAALQQFKLNPLLGTGSGTYLYYGRMFRVDRMQQDPIDVHNDYLHLLAEYGVLGGLLFLFFLVAHLLNGWRDFQRLGPRRVVVSSKLLSNSLALNLGALSSVAAYLVHSFVDFNLHIPANVLLLAFVFGLLANSGIQREKNAGTVPASLLAWRSLLAAIGLVLGIQSARLLPGEYFTEHARTAQRDNHPDEAIRFALRGLETEQKNPNLYRYFASAKLSKCDSAADDQARTACYDEAIDALTKARQLAPQDRSILLQLALSYDSIGRFTEGEWLFDEARYWDPKSIYLNEVYKYHLSRWRSGPKKAEPDQSDQG